MKKLLILLAMIIIPLTVYAAGRLQDADFATEAELVGRGATAASLLNDTKIYVTADGINKTLDDAIADGDIGGGFTDPMTTAGDLIFRNSGNTTTRLPIGTTNQLLTVINGTTIGWADAPVSTTLTTKGDIQTYDTANARLPVGTDGQILSANSAQTTGLEWIDNYAQPLTTKGDLFTYDTDQARLPVGSTGAFLTVDPAETTGLKWSNAVIGALGQSTEWKNAGNIIIEGTTTNPTKGTTTIDQVSYARLGTIGKFEYRYRQTTSGTAGSGDYLYTLPDGLEFADSVLKTTAAISSINSDGVAEYVIGKTNNRENSSFAGASGGIIPYDNTRFRVLMEYAYNNISIQDSGHFDLGDPSPFGFSIEFDAPIKGWNSTTQAVIESQQYNATNGNHFSAKIASDGTVISENVDFINGNCSVVSSVVTCTYTTEMQNALTVEPSVTCTAEGADAASSICENNPGNSTAQLVYKMEFQSGGAGGNGSHPVDVHVEKQGADFKKQLIITGANDRIRQDQYSETEIVWGLWNGEQLYRRCFTTSSSITTDALITTWATGLIPKGITEYQAGLWMIENVGINSNFIAIYYNDSNGQVRGVGGGSYSIASGVSFCMSYTK